MSGINIMFLVVLCLLVDAESMQSVRCYRRYGRILFKPIEFWQELGRHNHVLFRINEFYDFPHGLGHQQHVYEYNDICWRYKTFIRDFRLSSLVPQMDRGEWYDGCQVQCACQSPPPQ